MTSSKWTANGLLTFSLLVTAAACTGKHEDKASLPEKPGEKAGETAAPDQVAGSASPTASGEGSSAPSAVAPQKAAEAPPPALPPAPQEVTLRLTGQVTSVRSSKIGFKVGGFLKEIMAKSGQAVKKGDVLATLEDEDFKLRLEIAQARREQARVQYDAAKKELDREKQLKAENASTATVFEQRQTAFDSARMGLRLAELDVTQNDRNLADTKLKAPYDCVVREQLKFEGENVPSAPAATPVFDVVDTGAPEITFEAPELMLGKLKVGATLNVQVPSGGYSGKAEIVRVVPVISEKTRTFRVIAKLPAANQKVAPGSFAEAKVD